MTGFNPTRILGRWREGFALDFHTIRSIPLGYDEFGHMIFDTQRSEVGELLYRLKYRSDTSVVNDIVTTTMGFLEKWKPAIEVIVPVPPSRSTRTQQPVLLLAEALGKRLRIPVVPHCITRVRELPELKNVYDPDERLRLLADAFTVDAAGVRGQRVLLFDDLYRSGATMNTIAAVLYDQAKVADVYALTITRTRSKS